MGAMAAVVDSSQAPAADPALRDGACSDDDEVPPLLALLQASLPPGGRDTPPQGGAGTADGTAATSPSQQTIEALQGLGRRSSEPTTELAAAALGAGSSQHKHRRSASSSSGSKHGRWGWFATKLGLGSNRTASVSEDLPAGGSPPRSHSRSSSGGAAAVVLPGLSVVAANHHANGSAHRTSLSSSVSDSSGRHTPQPGGASPAALSSMAPSAATSAPSTAHPSPSVPVMPLLPGEPAGVGARRAQSNHRRSHSLTAFLKMGRRGRSSAGSEAELGLPGEATPPAPGSKHATPHTTPGASGLSCFGVAARHGVAEDEGEQVVAPAAGEHGSSGAQEEEEAVELEEQPLIPGVASPGALPPGIKNIGNTCYVNAALQCLRATPRLPLALLPDLPAKVQSRIAEAAQLQGEPSAAGEPASQAAEPAAANAGAGGGGEQGSAAAVRSAEAAVDVHREALARASAEVTEEAVEAARQALRAVSEGSLTQPATPRTPGGAVTHFSSGREQPASASAEQSPAADAGQCTEQPAGDRGEQQQEGEQPQTSEVAAEPVKPAKPARGELQAAVASAVEALYLQDGGQGPVDPVPLLRTLSAFPMAADYFDGGQHDCEEVLRVLMDLLHTDLNRAAPPDPEPAPPAPTSPAAGVPAADAAAGGGGGEGSSSGAEAAGEACGSQQDAAATEEQAHAAEPQAEPQGQGESEHERADRLWVSYLERDSSPITDLFSGQLQSSVTCLKCGGRFTMYEPYWVLNLPLAKEQRQGGSLAWLGIKGAAPATISDCLSLFTADERLEGKEAFHCEACGDRTPATKHLRLHRLPDALVLHIKRFKLKGATMDKLTNSVSFPLRELRLDAFVSPESGLAPHDCVYDLYAVSNHYGNLSGGHYTAMCRMGEPGGSDGSASAAGDAWFSFNDEVVSRVRPDQVVSQYAYILFYARRQPKRPASSCGSSATGGSTATGGLHAIATRQGSGQVPAPEAPPAQ